MASRKDEFTKLDNKLSLIQSRLGDLYRDRDGLEEDLQRKGLKPDMREILEARLTSLNDRIKAAQKEEWDTDDERYDALYYPKR
jgi:seryl-tRNA synthetase